MSALDALRPRNALTWLIEQHVAAQMAAPSRDTELPRSDDLGVADGDVEAGTPLTEAEMRLMDGNR